MMGRWFITPHAVTRYRERIRPKASYAQALGELIAMSASAHRVKVREDGAEEWRGGKPLRLRFRVSTDGQLLTVLRPHERWETRHGKGQEQQG